jgi:NhaA family Na+:H+ antiporter
MPPDHDPDARPARPGAVRRAVGPLLEFLATEAGGGAILLAATAVALGWANSPWAASYASLTHDVRHWVNEGLMTLFFFVVGLEIKRELVTGELASVRRALLPVVAALGGMALPALLYLSLNAGGAEAAGWGIPMATDIAFAVGALSFFPAVSASTRVFLLSLAIVDDIGAIVLIAAFYSAGISWGALAVACGLVAAIGVLRRLDVGWLPVYGALAILLWVATARAGVHATIAGVVLGLMAPARRGEDSDPQKPPLTERLVPRLHPWTSYVVVPLFALVNAGVELSRSSVANAFTSSVAIGIVAGLVVGKLAGVAGSTWIAVKLGLAEPEDGWRSTVGVAALAGIGFTVSLFIADLAFTDPSLVAEAKIGILAGSLLASLLGAVILRARATRRSGRARGA